MPKGLEDKHLTASKQTETVNQIALLTNLQEQAESASRIGSSETRVLKAKRSRYPMQNKRKIILTGDSHARGCAERLVYQLGNSYMVTGYVKPNAELGIITSTATEETKKLTRDDVLILCGDSRNIGKNDST
jgi:hypothetical protein